MKPWDVGQGSHFSITGDGGYFNQLSQGLQYHLADPAVFTMDYMMDLFSIYLSKYMSASDVYEGDWGGLQYGDGYDIRDKTRRFCVGAEGQVDQ